MSDEAAERALLLLVSARVRLEGALRLLDPEQRLRPPGCRRLLSNDPAVTTLPARVH